MLDQSTVDKLHAMRFPKMAEAYILQSKDPRYEAQSFEERFAALVDAEYQNRIVNRRRRLLKAAKLEQSHARLEEINYTCGRRLNRRLIEKLGTCEYIERNLNVFITGATGGGKTYLACALGYEACCHDYPTAFIRLSDYLTDIALARQENTYRKILKKYTNPKLLIIDEWLLVPPNEQERREIAELIHKRRRHASIIFCSQYDDREWFDQLGGENSPLAESILDRIVHDAYRVKLEAIDPEQDISMREIYGLKDEY